MNNSRGKCLHRSLNLAIKRGLVHNLTVSSVLYSTKSYKKAWISLIWWLAASDMRNKISQNKAWILVIVLSYLSKTRWHQTKFQNWRQVRIFSLHFQLIYSFLLERFHIPEKWWSVIHLCKELGLEQGDVMGAYTCPIDTPQTSIPGTSQLWPSHRCLLNHTLNFAICSKCPSTSWSARTIILCSPKRNTLRKLR